MRKRKDRKRESESMDCDGAQFGKSRCRDNRERAEPETSDEKGPFCASRPRQKFPPKSHLRYCIRMSVGFEGFQHVLPMPQTKYFPTIHHHLPYCPIPRVVRPSRTLSYRPHMIRSCCPIVEPLKCQLMTPMFQFDRGRRAAKAEACDDVCVVTIAGGPRL